MKPSEADCKEIANIIGLDAPVNTTAEQQEFEDSMQTLDGEHMDDPLRDDWRTAGVDDVTPVDTAMRMNGEEVFVT